VCETVFETSVMERKGKEKDPNLFFKRKRVFDFQFIEESIKKEDTASITHLSLSLSQPYRCV